MRKNSYLVAILSVIFLAGFTASASAQDGKALYDKSCKMCHNVDGKGNKAVIKMADGDLSKLDLTKASTVAKTDANLEKSVTDGIGKMKAYKDKLSADQVKAVVSHVRTLQKSK